MTNAEESKLDHLRSQIAQTVAQRDSLKQDIEYGNLPAREGFRKLIDVDARLSTLDSQFKRLWDEVNAK